jgi:hypothetical protein
MDEIQTQTPTQSTETSDLRAQYESLRHLVVSVLILLVVVSGTLNIFLLREFRNAGRDLDNFKPSAQEFMMNYQKNDGPSVENFLLRIVDYGRTHPDFAPILKKYHVNPGPGTGAPINLPVPPSSGSAPKASAPAPTPAAQPKK